MQNQIIKNVKCQKFLFLFDKIKHNNCMHLLQEAKKIRNKNVIKTWCWNLLLTTLGKFTSEYELYVDDAFLAVVQMFL
jgi:hypothetical protein